MNTNDMIIERYDEYLFLIRDAKNQDDIYHAFTCKDATEAARFQIFLGFCNIRVLDTYHKKLAQERTKITKSAKNILNKTNKL